MKFVFVDNLPSNARILEVDSLFERYGKVISIDVKNLGNYSIALVEFEEDRSAYAAANLMNRYIYKDKPMKAELYDQRVHGRLNFNNKPSEENDEGFRNVNIRIGKFGEAIYDLRNNERQSPRRVNDFDNGQNNRNNRNFDDIDDSQDLRTHLRLRKNSREWNNETITSNERRDINRYDNDNDFSPRSNYEDRMPQRANYRQVNEYRTSYDNRFNKETNSFNRAPERDLRNDIRERNAHNYDNRNQNYIKSFDKNRGHDLRDDLRQWGGHKSDNNNTNYAQNHHNNRQPNFRNDMRKWDDQKSEIFNNRRGNNDIDNDNDKYLYPMNNAQNRNFRNNDREIDEMPRSQRHAPPPNQYEMNMRNRIKPRRFDDLDIVENNKRGGNIDHDYERNFENKLRRTQLQTSNDDIPGPYNEFNTDIGSKHRRSVTPPPPPASAFVTRNNNSLRNDRNDGEYSINASKFANERRVPIRDRDHYTDEFNRNHKRPVVNKEDYAEASTSKRLSPIRSKKQTRESIADIYSNIPTTFESEYGLGTHKLYGLSKQELGKAIADHGGRADNLAQMDEKQRFLYLKSLLGRKDNLHSKDDHYNERVQLARHRELSPEKIIPEVSSKSFREDYSEENQPKTTEKVSLVVGLIDDNQPYGQITAEQWKIVDELLLQKIEAIAEAGQNAPSYCGKEWKFGRKVIRCKNQYTLEWLHRVIPKLSKLWPGAQLKVVRKSEFEFVPAGNVYINRDIDPEVALKILQSKNPELPTADWRILKRDKRNDANGGFYMTVQINQESEKLLYARDRRMFWASGTVQMQLKQRKNNNWNMKFNQ